MSVWVALVGEEETRIFEPRVFIGAFVSTVEGMTLAGGCGEEGTWVDWMEKVPRGFGAACRRGPPAFFLSSSLLAYQAFWVIYDAD